MEINNDFVDDIEEIIVNTQGYNVSVEEKEGLKGTVVIADEGLECTVKEATLCIIEPIEEEVIDQDSNTYLDPDTGIEYNGYDDYDDEYFDPEPEEEYRPESDDDYEKQKGTNVTKRIKIYVPKGTNLDNLHIENKRGHIQIKCIKSNNFYIVNQYGDIAADIEATDTYHYNNGSIIIDNVFGNVDLMATGLNNMFDGEIKNGEGNITAVLKTGKKKNRDGDRIFITNTVGEINARIEGTGKDIDVDNTTGLTFLTLEDITGILNLNDQYKLLISQGDEETNLIVGAESNITINDKDWNMYEMDVLKNKYQQSYANFKPLNLGGRNKFVSELRNYEKNDPLLRNIAKQITDNNRGEPRNGENVQGIGD